MNAPTVGGQGRPRHRTAAAPRCGQERPRHRVVGGSATVPANSDWWR